MKKLGFTLAEVLITLGIIGVVAAITIPNIINKYQEQAVVHSLTKAYSVLSQSYKYAEQKYGQPIEWELPSEFETGHLNNFSKMFEFMKKVKTCQGTNESCGIVGVYSNLNGDKVVYNEPVYSVTTPDGFIFMVVGRRSDCSQKRGSGIFLENVCSNISVDINGIKKPNINAKDKFVFYLTKYGIYPAGSINETRLGFKNGEDGNCADWNTAACTAWVLFNKNLDYLHCPEKLEWNGKSSCK